MKQVFLYCDGSSLGNPGAGGWCGILVYGDVEKVVSGGARDATNNQMELKAVIESLKVLKNPCKVELYSDSKYVCDGIGSWLSNWIKKDFKNVKNPILWKEYIDVSSRHSVATHWIKGHNGHIQNERCDAIAKQEALKYK